jgi:hypothetical protein
MGVWRIDDHAVALARKVDVVDVAPVAGEKSLVFNPAYGLTDPELGHVASLSFQMVVAPRLTGRSFPRKRESRQRFPALPLAALGSRLRGDARTVLKRRA